MSYILKCEPKIWKHFNLIIHFLACIVLPVGMQHQALQGVGAAYLWAILYNEMPEG